MYQLIRLGKCVHVLDVDKNVFVKSNFANIAKAINLKQLQLTRKQILHRMEWVRCTDPRCRFKNCRHEGHWIADHIIQYF